MRFAKNFLFFSAPLGVEVAPILYIIVVVAALGLFDFCDEAFERRHGGVVAVFGNVDFGKPRNRVQHELPIVFLRERPTERARP